MKKILLSTLIGLGIVSGAFAAGSYVENFDSYGTLSYSGSSASLNMVRFCMEIILLPLIRIITVAFGRPCDWRRTGRVALWVHT